VVPVQEGAVIFVEAHEPHRFHDIVEDLHLLVFFAPAEGTR
jgi:quercetin dioxygenase-like cupin family protein